MFKKQSKLNFSNIISKYKGGMITFLSILMIFTFSILTLNVTAAPDSELTYHGKLTDTSNVAVDDGNYRFILTIYDAETGGNCIWTSRGDCTTPTYKTVAISNGIFSTTLGESGDNTLDNITFNSNYYLDIKVSDDTITPSSSMTPRRKITPTGFALNSHRFNGLEADNYIDTSATNQIKTGGLTLGDDFTVNTNNFHVDTINGRVGIGTISPEEMLFVAGNDDVNIVAAHYGGSGQLRTYSAGGTISAPAQRTGTGWAGAWLTKGMDENSDWQNMANIVVHGAGDTTSTSSPGIMAFSTTPVGSTSVLERMRIDEDGNVGIGVTPTQLLTLQNGANNPLNFNTGVDTAIGWGMRTNTTNDLEIDTGDSLEINLDVDNNQISNFQIKDGTNNVLFFLAESGNTYLLPNGGDVGIGTISPNAKLHINGDAIVGDVAGSGTQRLRFLGDSSNISYIQVGEDNLDVNAKLHIARFSTSNTNIEEFRVYADENYFDGNIEANGRLAIDGNVMISNTGAFHTAQFADDTRYGYFEVKSDNGDRGAYFGFGAKGDYVDLRLEDGNDLYISGGNVGIGGTNSSKLYIENTAINKTGAYGFDVRETQTATVNGAYNNIGSYIQANTNISAGITNSGYLYGQRIQNLHKSAGNIANMTGLDIHYGNYTGGSGTTTNAFGLNLTSFITEGSITNAYGIHIGNVHATTNEYAIFQAGADDINYFAGNVGIGIGTSSVKLEVNGGAHIGVNRNANALDSSFSFHDSDGGNFTYTQLVEEGFAGGHALLWNGYKADHGLTGVLSTTGKIQYANDPGSYESGAGMINFDSNEGSIKFFISPESTGKDDDVVWGTSILSLGRSGNIGIGVDSPDDFTLQVAGHIGPDTDDTYDLGSTSNRFKDLFLGADTLHIGTSATDEGLISYDTTNNIFNFGTDTTTNGDIAFNTDDLFIDKSSGYVGIGGTGNSKLYVEDTATNNSGVNGLNVLEIQEITTNGTYYNMGAQIKANTNISSGVANSGYLIGQRVQNFHTSAGNLSALTGIDIQFGNFTGGSGTTTKAVGLNIASLRTEGSITNGYGIFIADINATNDYGIYQSGANDGNYFAGDVGVGVVSTNHALQVVDNTTDFASYIQNTSTTAGSDGLRVQGGVSTATTSYPLYVESYSPVRSVFYVRADGNYYHYGTAISTMESKNSIENFTESGLGLLNDINVVTYKYNDDDNDRVERIGFIANDPDNIYDDRLTNNKTGFDTNTIVGTLIKATQEQQEFITINTNDLTLKANANSVEELQTLINTELTTIEGQFTTTQTQIQNTEDKLIALEQKIDANTDINITGEIQDRLEILEQGLSLVTQIDTKMLTIDPNKLMFIEEGALTQTITEIDEDGNEQEILVDIQELTLNGILITETIRTKNLETNTLSINDDVTVEDEDGDDINASSIGTVEVIEDMNSLLGNDSNKIEVTVETTEVTKDSRIFLTVRDAPDLVVAQVKSIVDNEFTIEFDYIFDEKPWFIDWFVVGSAIE